MIRITTTCIALLAACVHADPAPVPSQADGDWPMLGGRPDRNMVSPAKNLPVKWNAQKDVKWMADLGDHSWSVPAVSGGRIFIGTSNDKPRDPEVKGDRGIFLCFSAVDGTFLWQAVHDKLYPSGDKYREQAEAEDFPHEGICSSPCVVGDRVYYVSNRAELVCCDALGFTDGENDGPFKGESRAGKNDADFIWLLDMKKELGIKAHQASAGAPLVVDGLVFIVTGQGRDVETRKVLNPEAPSFIAVEAATGKIVWKDSSPGDRIIAGQWGAPGYGVVDGQPQVAFPGGDGWLYSFEPKTGKLLWKFNCKAHEKVELDTDGVPKDRNQLLAPPVFVGNRVLIAVGVDPDSPGPPGALRAIDARKRGDITRDGELWRLGGEDFGKTMWGVAVHEGLVYAVEQDGWLNCIELETGKRLWRHDFLSTVWGPPLVADGKIYVTTKDLEAVVLATGREKKVLAKNPLQKDLGYPGILAANGELYIWGWKHLYVVTKTP